MHKVADHVIAAVGIPLIHLDDATAAAVRRADLQRIGLLGTALTMEQTFYRDRLAGHGQAAGVALDSSYEVAPEEFYIEELSLAPGWKAGGWIRWGLTDPVPRT